MQVKFGRKTCPETTALVLIYLHHQEDKMNTKVGKKKKKKTFSIFHTTASKGAFCVSILVGKHHTSRKYKKVKFEIQRVAHLGEHVRLLCRTPQYAFFVPAKSTGGRCSAESLLINKP